MISVSKALHIINSQALILREEEVSLNDALGAVLSKDIFSTINMPPFRQSAMDGYAIKWSEERDYQLTYESQAGNANPYALKNKEAVRIFTGALVPDEADTVVMQEHVEQTGKELSIQKMPSKYANIREMGEQIQAGDIALQKGAVLNAAAIGFLTCLGVQNVSVYQRPKVGILVTGNELQSVGSPLRKGSVYESNSTMLKAALQEAGITEGVEILRVSDDLESTKTCIKNLLEKTDLLLISGGISVGDYDFVKEALTDNQVDELFYKVNQKPGKPLWFGRKDSTCVFALPGNPASVLTCFYVYVYPLIQKWKGYQNTSLERIIARCTSKLPNKSGKTIFLKAAISQKGEVTPLQGQSSAMMHTYALSNALICVPEEKELIEVGEEVECIKLTP